MQAVLVAGGAGFIGSHLCEDLLNEGFFVICVDNLLTGDKKNIEPFLSNPNFKFIQDDIAKLKNTSKIDFIFQLASPASPNIKSPKSYMAFPIETLLVNSLGTQNLLEIARENNSSFLFASTSEIYGDPQVSPQSEDYNGNVNPNGPRSVYDEAKRFGEALTQAYHRKFGLNTRIVRIFNTYGPKMRADDGRVISNFINQALKDEPITVYGDGTQTRSFCYISDMLIGLKAAMFKDSTNGEVINIGNPEERTIKDIAEVIREMSGSSSKINYEELPVDDPKERKPDIAKAKNLLGWEPKVPLVDGLKKTIQYFKSQ